MSHGGKNRILYFTGLSIPSTSPVLASILGKKAGKDFYVNKPASWDEFIYGSAAPARGFERGAKFSKTPRILDFDTEKIVKGDIVIEILRFLQ